MTKVSIIGQPEKVEPVLKAIEFWDFLNNTKKLDKAGSLPNSYNYVELVAKDYGYDNDRDDEFDLIFAYDDPENRGDGNLYIGKFNDGIVIQ